MKSITEQLSTYKSVHLNSDNIKTHFVGIPLIIWSVALLLNIVSFELMIDGQPLTLGLATIIGLVALIYYVVLYIPMAILVLIIFGPIVYSTHLLAEHEYVIAIAVGVFVVGWILQFIGHAYEKAKPAFVDDLNQLLIGPLFLIAEIYFALGLNKAMEESVYNEAVDKRKEFERKKAAE